MYGIQKTYQHIYMAYIDHKNVRIKEDIICGERTKEDLVQNQKKVSNQILPVVSMPLSMLEVQLLDANGIHEREKHSEEHEHRRNNWHKFPVISKMMSNIVADCLVGLARD
jgi:hypothetical protein